MTKRKRVEAYRTTAILHIDGTLEVMGGPIHDVREAAKEMPAARALVLTEANPAMEALLPICVRLSRQDGDTVDVDLWNRFHRAVEKAEKFQRSQRRNEDLNTADWSACDWDDDAKCARPDCEECHPKPEAQR